MKPLLNDAANEALVEQLKAELNLLKGCDANNPNHAVALESWLKSFGFAVFCELKHGEIGHVLSLLQAGDITRSKAAEAIAEFLVGNKPALPPFQDEVFGEDELPRELVTTLRSENTRLDKQLTGYMDTVRAIVVNGLGLDDPYEENSKPWPDGLMSERVATLRTDSEALLDIFNEMKTVIVELVEGLDDLWTVQDPRMKYVEMQFRRGELQELKTLLSKCEQLEQRLSNV